MRKNKLTDLIRRIYIRCYIYTSNFSQNDLKKCKTEGSLFKKKDSKLLHYAKINKKVFMKLFMGHDSSLLAKKHSQRLYYAFQVSFYWFVLLSLAGNFFLNGAGTGFKTTMKSGGLICI